MKLLDTLVFEYEYTYKRQKHSFTVDYEKVWEELTFVDWKKLSGSECLQVKNAYRNWIGRLLSEFDRYLCPHESVTLAVNVFSLDNGLSVGERVGHLWNFLGIVNTEFKPCSSSCYGLDLCDCLDRGFQRFSDYIEKEKLSDKEKSVNFYAHFLAERNKAVITPLRITNILRSLEVVMLLKPSQSSTERIVSIIERVVPRRFSNVYRFGSEKEVDMVNVLTILKAEIGLKTVDKSLARRKYIDAKHRDVLMKTKSVFCKSRTVKNIAKSNVPKKKKKTLPLSDVKKSKYDIDAGSEDEQDIDDPVAYHQADLPFIEHSYAFSLSEGKGMEIEDDAIEVSVCDEQKNVDVSGQDVLEHDLKEVNGRGCSE